MSQLNCILSRRPVDLGRALSLKAAVPGLSDLEARLLSSRGVYTAAPALRDLVATPLVDLEKGALRISQTIERQELIVVVADYDCDGATACAVMLTGLRALGARVEYVVPDRMVHGYGISPSVVDLAIETYPQTRVLLTVDNGILGHTGISHAAMRGLDVVVTDHHLPGETLPDAWAVINPSRADCTSGLSRLAGVSVALWLVLATKAVRTRQGFNTPGMNFLLPYVALGTIADLVPLDAANRQLVTLGLQMIRKGQGPIGLTALIQESGITPEYLTTTDIGFSLGPRINAAGRLDTMHVGIDLLISQDPKQARQLAKLLTQTNEARKQMQREASEQADLDLSAISLDNRYSLVQADEAWHPGIIGLVASRLKEMYFRPAFVFSLHTGVAKGSGRSIPGFHLKDALEEIARRAPGVLKTFGGHAMAAGAQLESPEKLEAFSRAFEDVAKDWITPSMLSSIILSDGPKPSLDDELAARILRHPWGQGFEAPAFDEEVQVKSVRPLGKEGKHWKISAQTGCDSEPTQVVLFNHPEPIVGQNVHLYLQPNLNTWQGRTNLQWIGRILH